MDPVSGRVRPVTSTSRRTKALWNILSQKGLRTNVVGWFGGHPAEPIRGLCVSDAFSRGFPAQNAPWPLLPGTVWPESIAADLAPLRIRPEEIDAEIFRLFIPRLDDIDRTKPNLLPMLAKLLAECFTTHNAATWVMEHSPWDFMAVYYIGIDHFSHGFMNFHPPKPGWVDEKDFELYRDVVNGGYRLMDLFLARLLELAGPDTSVLLLSDHGFHSDHLRPARIARVPTGPSAQHRALGVLALAGDGIRQDERIYGVNLLDVAPTVLAMFGLPAGEDMPGRVLAEAFEETPVLDRIPGWDLVEGESGSHPAGYNPPPDDNDRLIEQFVALGYIAAQPEDRDLAAAESRRETKFNLARVHISTWHFEEALPMLEELAADVPERGDFALSLADCQLRLGLYDEAEASVAQALKSQPQSELPEKASPVASLIRGKIAFERRRYRASVEHFLEAERCGPRNSEVCTNIGLAWLRLRRWKDAERALGKALEIDPHSAVAHQGMANVRLRQGRVREAAECALTSIACRHDLPLSHFWLGVALVRLGDRKRAIQAFETSLSLHPPLRISHKMLGRLYGVTPEGDAHRRAAGEFYRLWKQEAERVAKTREEARQRAISRALEARIADSNQGVQGPALEFIVVSGLPRSGTSLMMQMLGAGGLDVKTDGERKADQDNPEGYYEWEAIKKVGTRPEILLDAEGKVIKVISMLLPSLPARHRYKVIFMDRPIGEVVDSQMRLRNARGTGLPEGNAGKMAELLDAHRSEILRGLKNAPGFEVLVVDYSELVLSPETWLPRIQAFVGPLPSPDAMGKAIKPELYRNRNVY